MRNQLLSTVFTLSTASTLTSISAAGITSLQIGGPNFETINATASSRIEQLSAPEQSAVKVRADYRSINSSNSTMGSTDVLDLTKTPNLSVALLNTETSNVKVPNNVLLKFFGDVSQLDLSKIQTENASSKLTLDLTAVTGMDSPYSSVSGSGSDASLGKNAIPQFVSQVNLPANAKQVAAHYKTNFVAPGAKTVYIYGASDETWTGFPSAITAAKRDKIYFIGFSTMGTLDVRALLRSTSASVIETSAAVDKLVMPLTSAAIKTKSLSELDLDLAGYTSASEAAAIALVDSFKTKYAPKVKLLHTDGIDPAELLPIQSAMPDLIDVADDEIDKSIERIAQKGIANVKELRIKASQVPDFFGKLSISDFTSFTSLETIEVMNDANNAYAPVALPGSTETQIVRSQLPASIRAVYSQNAVIIAGAIGGAIVFDKKFNASSIDLSQATGVTHIAKSAGFIDATVQTLHLPTDLDLSNATTRGTVSGLTALDSLSLYGTSNMTDLDANIPASLSRLDLSHSSDTTALPVMQGSINTVTVPLALIETAGAFTTFNSFEGAGKTLIITGDADGAAIQVGNLPDVETIDMSGVTNAPASFSAPLDTGAGHSELDHLYLPQSFDIVTPVALAGAKATTVYFSGSYPTASGNQALNAGYGGRHLNFEGVTDGGLFQIPASTVSLTLGNGVGGMGVTTTASVNQFTLMGATSLQNLTGLPTSATRFSLNNRAGSAFALDLTNHNNLTHLSLNASQLTSLALPTSAPVAVGGFNEIGHTYLNLSGITGLIGATPISNLVAFAQNAEVSQIALPRSMPADMDQLDLSSLPSSVRLFNIQNVNIKIASTNAADLVRDTPKHYLYDGKFTTDATTFPYFLYIEQEVAPTTLGGLGETALDLSDITFDSSSAAVAENQVDLFFSCLNGSPSNSGADKANVENIHFVFPDALNTGTIVMGRINGENYATGLHPHLRVSAHKNGGLRLEGAGFVSTPEVAQLLDTPAHTDNAATWTAWINQRIVEGHRNIDLRAVEFANQAQIDEFFSGLNNATNKNHIRRIHLGFSGGLASAFLGGTDGVGGTPATGLHRGVHIVTHSANPSFTPNVADGSSINPHHIHAHHDGIPNPSSIMPSWIDSTYAAAGDNLDYSHTPITTQSQLDELFEALDASENTTNFSSILLDLTGYTDGSNTAVIGRKIDHNVVTLKDNIRINVINKPAGITLNGAGAGATTQVNTAQITELDTLVADANAANWTTWLNAMHTVNGSNTINLMSVPFTTQVQLSQFFVGVNDSTNKANYTRIDVNLSGYGANAAVMGQDAEVMPAAITGLNDNLRVVVFNPDGATLSGAGGASGTAGQIDTDEVIDQSFAASNSSVDWFTAINALTTAPIGATTLDLSHIEITNNIQLRQLELGVDGATDKGSITHIILNLNGFSGSNTAVFGFPLAANWNANLKVSVYNKPANVNLVTYHVSEVIEPSLIWTRWLNHSVAHSRFHRYYPVIHLGDGNSFRTQAEVDLFFAGLAASNVKHRVSSIYMDLAGNTTNPLILGATNGDGTVAATGLSPRTQVFTYNKPDAEMSGIGGSWGTLHSSHVSATPDPLTATADDWRDYVNRILSTHQWNIIDARGVSFTTQAQLDTFFEGFSHAHYKKRWLHRIHLDFTGYTDGGNTAIIGRNTAHNAIHPVSYYLRVMAYNVPGGITLNPAGTRWHEVHQHTIHKVNPADATIPAHDAAQNAWETYIRHQAAHHHRHIDLSSVAFATQAQVDTFFAALNAVHHKHAIQSIILGLDGAFNALPLVLGATNGDGTIAATGLHPHLKVFVTGATPTSLTGVGGDDVGEVARIVEDGMLPPTDKTQATEWRSYILHHVSRRHHSLDLKDIPLHNDEEVAALQAALTSLPTHRKHQIRSIVLALSGGHLEADSFATTADKLTLDLDAAGLTHLEHLIVDLDETRDGTADDAPGILAVAGDGITLPSGANLIATNPYVTH